MTASRAQPTGANRPHNDGMEPRAYSRLHIALHWITAGLILAQLIVNDDMRHAFGERLGGGDAVDPLAYFHIVTGLIILGLTGFRLAIRLYHGAPGPAKGVPPLLHALAASAHAALYFMLVFMPVTGAIAWFGESTVAGTLHEIGRLILVALIAAHAFGALVEHHVMRNETLMRMLAFGDDP